MTSIHIVCIVWEIHSGYALQSGWDGPFFISSLFPEKAKKAGISDIQKDKTGLNERLRAENGSMPMETSFKL